MCRGTSRGRRHPPGSPHALSNESSWWWGAVAASKLLVLELSRAEVKYIWLDSEQLFECFLLRYSAGTLIYLPSNLQ